MANETQVESFRTNSQMNSSTSSAPSTRTSRLSNSLTYNVIPSDDDTQGPLRRPEGNELKVMEKSIDNLSEGMTSLKKTQDELKEEQLKNKSWLESKANEIQINSIQIITLLIAALAFVFVEIQLFRVVDTFEQILSLTLILLGSLVFSNWTFVILLHSYRIKSSNDDTNGKNDRVYIIPLLSILLILMGIGVFVLWAYISDNDNSKLRTINPTKTEITIKL